MRPSGVKPLTDATQKADRIRLAEEGLWVRQEAVISSGELRVEFNSARSKNKRGNNPYPQADKKDKDNGAIRVMAWAAIAKGFKSRLLIHEPDDILGPEDQREVVQQANDTLKACTRRRQEAARNPGTEELRVLQEVNANIEQRNIEENRAGRDKGRGLKRKAEQIFKDRPVPNTIARGGVNWSVYRQQV